MNVELLPMRSIGIIRVAPGHTLVVDGATDHATGVWHPLVEPVTLDGGCWTCGLILRPDGTYRLLAEAVYDPDGLQPEPPAPQAPTA